MNDNQPPHGHATGRLLAAAAMLTSVLLTAGCQSGHPASPHLAYLKEALPGAREGSSIEGTLNWAGDCAYLNKTEFDEEFNEQPTSLLLVFEPGTAATDGDALTFLDDTYTNGQDVVWPSSSTPAGDLTDWATVPQACQNYDDVIVVHKG